MAETFDPAWLALRNRTTMLRRTPDWPPGWRRCCPCVRTFSTSGPERGACFRRLAPVIGRAQAWTFAEADEAMLGEAFDTTAFWAERNGWTVTWPGRRCCCTPGPGVADRRRGDGSGRDSGGGLPLRQADAVVCSALLDLVSAAWIERLAAALQVPFLACLTVDGRDAWMPRDPADRRVMAAFRRDYTRHKGLGHALGTHALPVVRRVFAERGFAVYSAASDWRVKRGAAPMITRLALDIAGAARAAIRQPGDRRRVAGTPSRAGGAAAARRSDRPLRPSGDSDRGDRRTGNDWINLIQSWSARLCLAA